jgi:hypothetical protein
MAEVQYDPRIIVMFAQRLYDQAARIVALCVALGAVAGFILGAIAGNAAFDAGIVTGALAAFVFGAFGYAVGQGRAFALRLQAQTALCQVQIEANTRGAHGSGSFSR